jgi:hypothetical protein
MPGQREVPCEQSIALFLAAATGVAAHSNCTVGFESQAGASLPARARLSKQDEARGLHASSTSGYRRVRDMRDLKEAKALLDELAS